MLFAQQGGAGGGGAGGGGGGLIELLQVIFVLLFIFGPAVLKLLFSKQEKKTATPDAPRPATINSEIDEFLTRQSSERLAEKVMVRTTNNKRSQRVRPRRSDAAPTTATPIAALSHDTLALSVSTASDVTHRKHFIHPVTTMLHNPSTLMNAVVLSEILKRPDAAQW